VEPTADILPPGVTCGDILNFATCDVDLNLITKSAPPGSFVWIICPVSCDRCEDCKVLLFFFKHLCFRKHSLTTFLHFHPFFSLVLMSEFIPQAQQFHTLNDSWCVKINFALILLR
jgi:hypothetical protein